MTKEELFDYVQRYNNVAKNKLTYIAKFSYYNHNYYYYNDEYILYGESDDDDYTAWYLCDKDRKVLCFFGESFITCGDIIEVFDDIGYMDFYM